jgi:indole-3-glycerol phosphate synthase
VAWLDELCAERRSVVAGRRRRLPPARLLAEIRELEPTRGFAAALRRRDRNGTSGPLPAAAAGSAGSARPAAQGAPSSPVVPALPAVIAEIKFASPSRGEIRRRRDVEEVARAYEAAGAAAVSVLTEETRFGGSLSHLARARLVLSLPLLCKDFVLDAYQLLEARLAGADAVLLMAALLSRAEMAEMLGLAEELGLDALVEIHDEEEREKIAGLPVRLLGVNHRDLRALTLDPTRGERLASRLPADAVRVAESGITTGADLARMAELGYDAVLVGSRLMQEEDPGAALSSLLEEARASR